MHWRPWKTSSAEKPDAATPSSGSALDVETGPSNRPDRPPKWSMGILNDRKEDEVPGSVLLLPKPALHNEPLGLRHEHARTSASSLPSPYGRRSNSIGSRVSRRSRGAYRKKEPEKKLTADGTMILDPQPDDSPNDPLNWAPLRRDAALLSIGFYCMVGGGMTTILAAGFSDIAYTYGVSEPSVALTTGMYMMGMGMGSVIASPTAILFGKRPVYLGGALLFILSAVWCALSPSYASLLVARILQGFGVSPVECLPSATVAEIFFLHERAYRLGIYTLLLLGGKNLTPLASAAVIQSLGWRWVFWMVAIVLGFGSVLLFFFVPETFWDRTPTRHHRFHDEDSRSSLHFSRLSLSHPGSLFHHRGRDPVKDIPTTPSADPEKSRQTKRGPGHVGFADQTQHPEESASSAPPIIKAGDATSQTPGDTGNDESTQKGNVVSSSSSLAEHSEARRVVGRGGAPQAPQLHSLNSPLSADAEKSGDYFGQASSSAQNAEAGANDTGTEGNQSRDAATKSPRGSARRTTFSPPMSRSGSYHGEHPAMVAAKEGSDDPPPGLPYTEYYRRAPAKSYVSTLKPWVGRLSQANWFKVMLRPFILFAYPAVLWSTLTYSFSIGWLIVISESVTEIYRSPDTYNFSALGAGLIYISPFVGGVLGTAVAGRVSDLIVQSIARRNDGVYEPEFRLVMAIPVAFTTSLGLMGFGWSAAERDAWIVPTIFFGIVSFGCSLGSTTAITFCVDSYRQYAGEALVTLNFSKNIFHGLVFSLFFTTWLADDGSKIVFIAIGVVQLAVIIFAIPMYIYGKRARMWTVRKAMMDAL